MTTLKIAFTREAPLLLVDDEKVAMVTEIELEPQLDGSLKLGKMTVVENPQYGTKLLGSRLPLIPKHPSILVKK